MNFKMLIIFFLIFNFIVDYLKDMKHDYFSSMKEILNGVDNKYSLTKEDYFEFKISNLIF